MHYFNFNIGDYASHTRHLSLLEDLAYRRLIDAYYLSEKPFTGSPADIAKDIGMMSEIEEVFYVLTKFFDKNEDGSWFNKRCDEEIARYHEKQEQAVKAGKASAQARFNRSSTVVQPTNNQEPITKKQIKPMPVGFDLFWDAYDKKVGKPNSIKAWSKIVFKDDLLQKIVEKAKADRKAKPDNKFRKDPERWLKGQHWLDEVVIEQTAEEKLMPLGTDAQIEAAYRIECGGDPTKARFNSYQEMRKFIQDFRDKKAKAA
jgi:uncharacterized protein YdaU (DUF1376 family)